MLEQELGKYGHKIPVLGYVPEDDAFRLESRHLGLVTPQELTDLREQTERAGNILTESVNLEQLLKIAGEAPEIETSEIETDGSQVHRKSRRDMRGSPLRGTRRSVSTIKRTLRCWKKPD